MLRKSILERLEKDNVCSFIEVMVHSVPLLERIKKKEVDKIKNFEVVGSLLIAAQSEVNLLKFRRSLEHTIGTTARAKMQYYRIEINYYCLLRPSTRVESH